MNRRKSRILIPCIILSFFIFGTTIAEAGISGSKYVVVYDQLYQYGEATSQALELYRNLKSEGNNVLLLQTENMKTVEIEKGTGVIVIASSFGSMEQYKNTVDYYKNQDYSVGFAPRDKKGLLIGIDEIYPFSDLNKLIDLAENLNSRGIQFICNIMPVYENYEMEAFDHFIEALKYVQKMGGEFFIHYPIFNDQGAYDMDIRPGLERAVKEYRNRGLRIYGIALPSDALFMDAEAYQGLGVHFLLIEESGKKIDSELDLFKISKELDPYVLFNGINEDQFSFFKYRTSEDINQPDLVELSLEDDAKKIDEFLTGLNIEKINMKDFEPEAYNIRVMSNDIKVDEKKADDNRKTELDQFKEEELKKIKGENLEQEQELKKEYDISRFGSISVKIVGIILLLLAVQVFVGRRYDYRKYFKK